MSDEKNNNDSVIEIVQKMVQEGQPRDKIISTLINLGVNEEQAKRLLLIAEADTFTLLKKEINSLVKQQFNANKKDFEEVIHRDLNKLEEKEKKQVDEIAKNELVATKNQIMEESKAFEEKVNSLLNSSQKTVSLVKKSLDSLNKKVNQLDLEMEQLKIHKYRKKNLIFSYAMLSLGAILLVISVGMFILYFNSFNISQMIMISVISLTSVALMFASIIS